jgi:hypothetical protein
MDCGIMELQHLLQSVSIKYARSQKANNHETNGHHGIYSTIKALAKPKPTIQ